MIIKKPFHIAFFVDGFTLKKVNNFYRNFHPFKSTLDFMGIRNWARCQALHVFKPKKKFAFMECHYYHHDKDPKIRGTVNDGIFNFERELRYAGFQIHYPKIGGDKPNLSLIEDAILFAEYNKVDAVVLLTTQGQFSILPNKLQAMGIPTLLLGWNFTFEKNNHWIHWKTDSLLRDNSAYYIAMEHIANNNPPSKFSYVNLFKLKSTSNPDRIKRIYSSQMSRVS